jgi:hypothetical protein
MQSYLLLSSGAQDRRRCGTSTGQKALHVLQLPGGDRHAIERRDHVPWMKPKLRECAAIAAWIDPHTGRQIA